MIILPTVTGMQPPFKIVMTDLQAQYRRLKPEIDQAIQHCLEEAQFIRGRPVKDFEQSLAAYTGAEYVVSCGNGTDALQLACMALDLRPGEKVIVPAFTYIATVEVLKLLGLQPVYCDVDERTFMLTAETLEQVYTPDCKAVMVVHLYGQCAEMEAVLQWAEEKGLYIIEDNAQAIGACGQIAGEWKQAGTIGHIGTTSFFPSKNLGAYGDGGALFTSSEALARKLRMIANHGQSRKYYHDLTGVNSRLDTLQAAILQVKLKYLDQFIDARRQVAAYYDEQLAAVPGLRIPERSPASTHVFHQYTLTLDEAADRPALQSYLSAQGIPSVVYYPLPVYRQEAYRESIQLPVTERLCRTVLSLPVHTEMNEEQINYICGHLKAFLNG